ncbi:hypothetical protein O9K51_04150 [Purpureocillium lavendulum]|uniref:Uncharacterized protein n=1 Tax=Purpureocillium lavendulum TaxID=1247861 RepID=A0AB34FWF8_9HYPO|nr:hypothetical protein O9K51_04150 [Purpureocillium lavendulum]
MCEDLHNVTVCELCARETPHRQSVARWCPVARLRSHFGLCDFGAQHVELKHAGTCRRCRRGAGGLNGGGAAVPGRHGYGYGCGYGYDVGAEMEQRRQGHGLTLW